MNIIVCDDSERFRKKVESIVGLLIEANNYVAHIKLVTSDPFDILDDLDNFKHESNIYILDVGLSTQINGIELARRIREKDSKGYIIFVTAHIELSMLTFKYKIQALDYIDKADSATLKKRLGECFEVIFKRAGDVRKIYNPEDDKTLSLDMNNKLVNLKMREIVFFETTEKEHKIRVHTDNGQIEFYGTLKDMESQLSCDFFKIHRSFIINLKKVESLDKTKKLVALSTGQTCYVSIKYYKGLTEKLKVLYGAKI